MPKGKSDSVPAKMQAVYDEIIALTDAVCRQHLDEEYAQLARLMTAALARKRPSPLDRGRKDVWAASIVYCLGTVNFLFDKSQVPCMGAEELVNCFGVSQKTAANKARQIMETLDICQADPNWWRPSNLENNPLAWYVMVNGLMVDARKLPLEVQEELVRRGLIPFLPKSKAGPEKEEPQEDENESKVGEGMVPGGKGRVVHFKIERL